jgi:protein phosphatase
LLPQIYRERAKQLPEGATEDARIADFAATVVEVSQRIQAAGRQKSSCHHMGTTLVAVLIARGHAHITHLGDSRAYVLRKRTLHQLTQDHSVVNMLVQLGEITAEEADTHPAQNQLTAFAGIRRPVHPDVAMLKLRTGDRLLLCTDGLWTTVPSAEMRDILAECATPRTACRRLIAKGNAGGGHDNLTALVVDYTATAASQAASKKNTVKLSPARTQKINAAPGSPPR